MFINDDHAYSLFVAQLRMLLADFIEGRLQQVAPADGVSGRASADGASTTPLAHGTISTALRRAIFGDARSVVHEPDYSALMSIAQTQRHGSVRVDQL